jgi:hypothetical protein
MGMRPRIFIYAMASLALLLFYAPFHAISAFFAGLLDRFRWNSRLRAALTPAPARAAGQEPPRRSLR